jgi:hypothetical protein
VRIWLSWLLEWWNGRVLALVNGCLDIRYDRGIDTHGGRWEQLFNLGGDDEGVLDRLPVWEAYSWDGEWWHSGVNVWRCASGCLVS